MKQNVHLLKVCLSHTVIIFVNFLLSFDNVGICFLQHPIPGREHQISSRSPYHQFKVDNSRLTKLISCQIRRGQIPKLHRLTLRVVTYIHAQTLMYDLFSNTVALRNFLPTAYGYDAFFMGSLSLINTHLSLALMSLEVMIMIRLYPSCNPPHCHQ